LEVALGRGLNFVEILKRNPNGWMDGWVDGWDDGGESQG